MTAPQDPFSTPQGSPGEPTGFGAPGGQPQPEPPAYGEQPTYGAPTSGAPAYGAPAYGSGPDRVGSPQNGMGIAALVLGILSLLSWFLFIGGLLGIVAVVLGVLARKKAKRGQATNGGVALAGIITGAIGVLLTALVIAGIATLFGSGEFSNLRECIEAAGDDRAAQQECADDFEQTVS